MRCCSGLSTSSPLLAICRGCRPLAFGGTTWKHWQDPLGEEEPIPSWEFWDLPSVQMLPAPNAQVWLKVAVAPGDRDALMMVPTLLRAAAHLPHPPDGMAGNSIRSHWASPLPRCVCVQWIFTNCVCNMIPALAGRGCTRLSHPLVASCAWGSWGGDAETPLPAVSQHGMRCYQPWLSCHTSRLQSAFPASC